MLTLPIIPKKRGMKLVDCHYLKCGERRIHYERQDEKRPHQKIEVEENYYGKTWCSLECAALDGEPVLSPGKDLAANKRWGWNERQTEYARE